MFVLYKRGNGGGGPEYHVLAGNKYASKKVPEEDRVMELATDLEVVNKLKTSHQVREAQARLAEAATVTSLKVFKKILLLEFLALQDCEPAHFQVCRECGQMADTRGDRPLGTTSIKPKEIQTILKFEQNWACKACRIELAVLSWEQKNKYHSEIIVGKFQEINHKINDLMGGDCSYVRNVIRITPISDDYKVIVYIKQNLTKTTLTKENETSYKESIIRSFVNFHCRPEDRYLIRVCERCGHFWKNKKDVGYSSIDTSEACQILNNGRNWVCGKCSEYPSLVLLAFEERNKSIGYSIELNERESVPEDHKFKQSYVKHYVCMEFYDKGGFSSRLSAELIDRGILRVDGDLLRSTLSELHLMNTMLQLFMGTTNAGPCKICTYCRHIFDSRDIELGFFWANRDLPLPFHVCPHHALRSILYWNMTGWKTLDKVTKVHQKILEEADIVCLTETHLVEELFGDHDEYFSDRVVVGVSADKRCKYGRGSGGLMFLIKNRIMCSQTKMSFSEKGIFQKIQFPNETYIIGVIYWKPNPGETESLNDWIKELDNFFIVNGGEDIKFIIGGDFNGRIKVDDGYTEADMFRGTALSARRKSADGMMNKRGRELLKLMRKHKMVLCNGRTKSDKAGSYTSRTVNGESVVDYVFVSANLVRGVKDMVVRDIHSTSADFHRGLLLTLN